MGHNTQVEAEVLTMTKWLILSPLNRFVTAVEIYLTESVGKALWHQITTVVILRENMKQTKQRCEASYSTGKLEIQSLYSR